MRLFYPYCRLCNSRDVLDVLPKRLRLVEERGLERDRFWGFWAREQPCYAMMALYTLVCMIAPLTCVFLWLFRWDHPFDLQNTSVPAMLAMSFLVLFWSYLTTASKDRNTVA
jgi:hypothetical protein